MSEQSDNGVSIGQGDQSRERAMEAEQFKRDSQTSHGADPTATPAEQRREAEGRKLSPRTVRVKDEPDDFHPGQAEQPDRDASPGLTGTGPAQPLD